MKKALSLILAVMMLLGCMSVTAFAYENVRGDESTINSLTLAVGDVIPVTKDLVDEEDKVTNLKFYNLNPTWAYGDTERVFTGSVPDSYCISLEYPSCPSTGVLLVTKAWDETDKTIELVFYASEEDIPAAPSGKSGNTDITATVPAITYNIVIPASTALTEENHTDVLLGGANGKATVEITAHPSDLVNIYYTVDLSAGDLTDGNSHTIAATYTYAQGGDYAAIVSSTSTDPAPTKVTVYTGGKVVDSTIKVTADDTEWMAAPSGDYTASVVFNFAKEEVKKVTIADLLNTVEGGFPTTKDNSNWDNGRRSVLYVAGEWLYGKTSDEMSSFAMNTTNVLTKAGENQYTCVDSGCTWVFTLSDGVLQSVATENNPGGKSQLSGRYTEHTPK